MVLTKEANLQDKLFIDSYARHSLVDHFFDRNRDRGSYYRGELQSDFHPAVSSVEQAEAGVLILQQGQLISLGILVVSVAILVKKWRDFKPPVGL